MVRRSWLLGALVACLSLVSLTVPQPAGAAGTAALGDVMPDANYRACVVAKLGLPADGEPTAEQLASITELSCTGRSIADATGTSAMPHLTKLFLDNNMLTDVAPLSGSTEIFSLGLAGNRLTSISGLSTLTKLTSVNLANNRLRDVSVLGTLPEYSLTSGTRFGQQATAPDATAGTPAVVPTIIGARGNVVTPTTPSGAAVSGTSVTYAEPGTYTWSFRDDTDFYFNGSVSVTVTADSGTTIPDPALRTCVNAKIGVAPEAQPTPAQLAAATGALTCRNAGITDLTGINLMTGLTSATLTGNSIADLAPLSTLTNLTLLDIAQNEVTSLSGLGSLPKLGTLRVNQTGVSTKAKLQSLAGVQRLTGLTALTVNYSEVSALGPLAGHPTLKTLNATNSRVGDVTPLAATTSLNSIDLTANRVADLSPLQGRSFGTLKILDQTLTAPDATATESAPAPRVTLQDGSTLVATPPSGVTVTDGTVTYAEAGSYSWTFTNARPPAGATFSGTISQRVDEAEPPVEGVDIPDTGLRDCLAGLLGQPAADPITAPALAGLSTVSCVDRGIADLTGAEHLTGATEIVLSTNQITDPAPLAGLGDVDRLLLPGNRITDPSALAPMTGLQVLNLSYNPVSSVSSLSPLTALTDLEVTQRSGGQAQGLTSLEGIEQMTSLTRLVANNSRLEDLAPVAGLTSLERLFVSSNTISDLRPVEDLTGLTGLGLADNRISDVAPLRDLTQLTSVDLGSNRIADLSPLGDLTDIGFLGLKARWQQVTATEVPAQQTVTVPSTRDRAGRPATLTAPAGVQVTDGKVRYPQPGSYEWSFTASDGDGEYFSGTITQQVTDPVGGAAEIPDTQLRRCLAEAAGLGANGQPSEADLAALTAVDCSDRAITDLTGSELLTSTTTLDLAGNPLAGLGPIGALTSLTDLDLSATGLDSVTALVGLTGLTSLTVDDNELQDLSPLGELDGLDALSATGQRLALPDVRGGVVVDVPTAVGVDGTQVRADLPDGATAQDDGAVFALAGDYRWPFEDGGFSGNFAQRVTTDLVDPEANAGAPACVRAGNVWVVVERDTGLQKGGCATEFRTGLQALRSAGFEVTGTGLVTGIDGYPPAGGSTGYWSYWHAERPTSGDQTRYPWTYSDEGAGSYAPEPGSIEGWRFGVGEDEPSWQPVIRDAGSQLTAGPIRMTYGRAARLPVTVTPATATGRVTTSIGGTAISAPIVDGTATLRLPARSLKPGARTLTLGYAGDGDVPAASARADVRVVKATPKVGVTVKPKTVKRGKPVTFTVKVRAAGVKPTGAVSVTIAGRTARATLNGTGVATVRVTGVSRLGKQTATVRYAGSGLVKAKTVKVPVTIVRQRVR